MHSNAKTRQFWIELPREAFDQRFESGRPPLLTNFDLGSRAGPDRRGILRDRWRGGRRTSSEARIELGEQFMDILALALSSEPGRQSADDKSVKSARLRSVKAYIEAHSGDSKLSLGDIAKKNGISLRYLHQLFV